MAQSNVSTRRICLLGLENIPVFLPGYGHHRVGGEQVQQSLLACALAIRGYSVSMVTMDYGQQDGAVHEGVTLFKAYSAAAGIPGLRFIHPRWTQLWSALRRANADVYYTSCAGFQVGILALFCLVKGRRFVFRIAHDDDCQPDRLLIRFWRDKKLYEYGLRRCSVVLAQSTRQIEALKKHYGLNARLATMLVERPAHLLPLELRDIDILWVNNFRQFKRPDIVIDLAERLPHRQFHLVGGPNDADLYAAIKNRSNKLPNVIFHGPVPYRDVGRFYDRCKVFVNTSDTEGFPNSYLQSWIRGAPVVAFFDPDNVIVREGLGHQARDLADMQSAVEKLLNDSSLLLAAGRRCREYMRREYDEDTILAPYLNAFDAVKAHSPRGAEQ
jgi:glycosyltransferase involved in cell wall biosynthesis